MSATPLVDVAIPTYGKPVHLREAIESALNQTYGAIAVRIFENGPGDGETAELVRRYASDPRVRHVPSGTILSQAENFTRCIRAGEAPYVAWLHDDDRWDPEFLERRVAFLEDHPECGFVFSAMREIASDGSFLWNTPHRLAEGVHSPHEFVPLFVEEMVVGTPTALVRRSAYEDVGASFTQDVKNSDWDIWLRIALRHPVGYLAVRDCARRLHGGSATAGTSRWGEEELRLVARFERLVAQELPDVRWPERARRRRRAGGHLTESRVAIERGDRRRARAHVRAALAEHPAAVLDPRWALATTGLVTGEAGRRAIARVRARRARQDATPLRPHLSDWRRLVRDQAFRVIRG